MSPAFHEQSLNCAYLTFAFHFRRVWRITYFRRNGDSLDLPGEVDGLDYVYGSQRFRQRIRQMVVYPPSHLEERPWLLIRYSGRDIDFSFMMGGVRPSSRRSHCLCVHRRRLSIVLEVTLRSRTLRGVGDPVNSMARGKDSGRSKGFPGCDRQYTHPWPMQKQRCTTVMMHAADTCCRCRRTVSELVQFLFKEARDLFTAPIMESWR